MKVPKNTNQRKKTQYTLPFSYPLFVKPKVSGFLGIKEIQKFIETEIDPYASSVSRYPFILDFSKVKVWDIASLLWIIVALHHYLQKGFKFLLRLPEPKPGMDKKKFKAFEKSAEFLRRWKFDVGLKNLTSDPRNLLVPEQKNYFDHKNFKYYKNRKVLLEDGKENSLISQRLTCIHNLSNINAIGNKRIERELIDNCIDEFEAEDISSIISRRCGINIDRSDLFVDVILSEALNNTYDHADATIGLVTVGILGATKELILAVADNGLTIPMTIFEKFKEIKNLKIEYMDSTVEDRAEATNIATWEGVSSKPENDGMGLYFIKKYTLKEFGGKLRILTDSSLLNFKTYEEGEPEKNMWTPKWKGNLLRISLPIIN